MHFFMSHSWTDDETESFVVENEAEVVMKKRRVEEKKIFTEEVKGERLDDSTRNDFK
jgi:hypothetical protein